MNLNQDIYGLPYKLAEHYSQFKVQDRVLLTGHSHQAQPNCAYDGIKKAWEDACEFVDYKWERAFEKAEVVRQGYANWLNDKTVHYALASNTHDLLIRYLSCFDYKSRPKIITTDSEFHTVRRQLDRLAEEGPEIIKIEAEPAETLAERMLPYIDDSVALVIVSKVLFRTGRIINNLGIIEEKCLKHGASFLVDAYHCINVIPFDIEKEGLTNSFVVGGGYKYCQLGEGNCFLRIPPECNYRPAITGWFSEFTKLTDIKKPGEVLYGDGHWQFAGSTYDPISHYRAAEVLNFFQKMKLTPEVLREINLHQIGLMISEFKRNDLNPAIISYDDSKPITASGGFLVLKSPKASIISKKLYMQNVFTDFREEYLRLGPAPYVSDAQLIEAMQILKDIVLKMK